ncbi:MULTISPECIES: flagellar basal body P-ring formation chaperone FlgA [Enterobacterales]|uniref:flagellar basal body P-ring formation chaperone FlgA n=1 Tax=Enterobacterales TaxID=91347 RepID=UPI002ED8C0DB
MNARKRTFLPGAEIALTLLFALPTQAAVHPVQNSAREQINAQVLSAASRELDALAAKAQWHDYRYTFNIYIPSMVASAPLCAATPRVARISSAGMVLSRMNFEVNCPGNTGWHINVAVRPDVYVPVVMPKSVIARDTVLTVNDLQLKKFNISGRQEGLMLHVEEATGLTAKRTLQPGKPLTRAELVTPMLVKRDQPVTIVSRRDGITASMPGVALKNGRKGDVINIRNTSSQRVISGMVDDTGIVTPVNTDR